MAKLHLGPDASLASLRTQLDELGHDVTDASADWVGSEDRPEAVLLKATTHDRVVFTFRVREMAYVARRHPRHGGVIVAAQHKWSPEELVAALHRALTDESMTSWTGRVVWLNRWQAEPDQE